MNYVLQVYTISKSNLLLEILLINYRKLLIIKHRVVLEVVLLIEYMQALKYFNDKEQYRCSWPTLRLSTGPQIFRARLNCCSLPIICGFATNILRKHIFRMAPIGTTGLSYLKMLKFIYFDIFGLLRRALHIGQTKSKWFFQDDVSSKEQTNKFNFTTKGQ